MLTGSDHTIAYIEYISRNHISPSEKSKSHVFLNVLSVMDKAVPDGPAVQKVEMDHFIVKLVVMISIF